MQQAEGDTAFAEFFLKPIRMGAASDKEGRDIFEDREYVRILIPGDNKTIVVQEVKDEHRQRFARAYDAWKKTGQVAHDGTPLESWPAMSPARIQELKFLNIYTVEHVAGLSDAQLQRVGMGARELKVKAQAFLDTARDSGTAQKLALENETMKADLQRKDDEIRSLAGRLDELEKRLLSGGTNV